MFVFRNQECSYEAWWGSDDEFHFAFCHLGGGDFIDEAGDEYFIHCQYCRDNEDDDLCSPWYFERWYEHESLNACDYFNDKLTEDECDHIKEFMKTLMDKPEWFSSNNTENHQC